MEFIDFSTAIDDIFLYFGNTQPKDGRKRSIYDGVKNIPGGALESISRHIKRESDSLPRNLGKAFTMGWGLYRSRHPEKIRKFETESCNECFGNGMLTIEKTLPGGREEVSSFSCRKCNNWKKHFSKDNPSSTRAELEARGLSVIWPKKSVYDNSPSHQPQIEGSTKLKQLTDKIGVAIQ